VICGAGLTYAVPQRLARVTKLRGMMQLRVKEPVRGHLVVRAGELTLYRRHIVALPERRILLDLDSIRIPQAIQEITMEIAA